MFESMWCLLGQDMSGTSSSRITGGDTHMWASQLVHNDLRGQQDAVSVAYLRSDYLVKLDNFTLLKPNEDEGYKIGVGSNFAWVHAMENFDYIMLNTVSLFFFYIYIYNIPTHTYTGSTLAS
jgi:hypothetical protein